LKKLILIPFIVAILTIQNIQAKALPEYTIKAAYLYNFALLTQWSSSNENQSDEFNLCFYKEDFGIASDTLKNKIMHDKKIKVSNISSIEEAQKCQMVFIRKEETIQELQLVQTLSQSQVLIVTDNEKIENSHITILSENTKLVFNINLKYLKHTNLAVSSHLLKLAKKIIQ